MLKRKPMILKQSGRIKKLSKLMLCFRGKRDLESVSMNWMDIHDGSSYRNYMSKSVVNVILISFPDVRFPDKSEGEFDVANLTEFVVSIVVRLHVHLG